MHKLTNQYNMKKGFTLIELLIVIAILAILATVTVLVLNPAQLFAQARDSQRISDLGTLKSAISLYLTTVTSPSLQGGSGFTCGTNFGSDKASVTSPMTSATEAHAAVFAIDGSGWIAVNMASTTGGAPLATLPRDPVTTGTTYFYSYSCDNTNKTFELDANMESARYANGGSDDLESTDGGNNANYYETGTDPGLDL
jgi:prepilin-type N-terminal cleavage/methylation domain-containing protein